MELSILYNYEASKPFFLMFLVNLSLPGLSLGLGSNHHLFKKDNI